MTKTRKIFWGAGIAAVVFIALLIALPYLGKIASKQAETTGGDTPSDPRLADPNLLYAATTWSGLCGNDKGEQGGCSDYFYLYLSGKFIHEFKWVKWERSQKQPSISSEEKQLGEKSMAKIIKLIRDGKFLDKNCPPQEIYDAGWFYQINLDGVKKSFTDSSEDCTVEFNKVLELIDSEPAVE